MLMEITSCHTGPTFRAEYSFTSRHLAEFWMIEPEIAFATLEDAMRCAEDYVQFCCKFLLEKCMCGPFSISDSWHNELSGFATLPSSGDCQSLFIRILRESSWCYHADHVALSLYVVQVVMQSSSVAFHGYVAEPTLVGTFLAFSYFDLMIWQNPLSRPG
jgi:hypothetical protein